MSFSVVMVETLRDSYAQVVRRFGVGHSLGLATRLGNTLQILQKAIITSSFINYLALLKLLSVSQISSNRYLSFLIIALSAQQLIYNQSPPPSFFANRTSNKASELLTQINPFLRSDISSFQSTNSLPLNILYRGPYSSYSY